MRHVLHLLETNAATMASKTLVMVTSSIAQVVLALAVPPVIVQAVLEAQVHTVQTVLKAQALTVPEAQALTVPEAQAHTVPEAQALTVPEAQVHTVPEAQAHTVLVDHLVLEESVILPGEIKTRDDLL